ncbi:MAG: ATP-binding protein [Clostridiales bacterium]|nr:ATP-binding protein [Clostridiales bacterium]
MIKREMYMKRIRPFIDREPVKVMTGMRRAGKSVMLDLIKDELRERGVGDERIISINFEDMRNSRLCFADTLHEEILKRAGNTRGRVYLFFDEIQEVEAWEKCVNSLRVALDCDIYITGSNAKLLSGELATYLGGRYVEFVIYPFSFAEFLELYRTLDSSVSEKDGFQKYLTSGGMPYLANLGYDEEPSRQYLTDLFGSVMLKDIVKRGKIRDVDMLERIVAYLTVNVGTTFSSASITKFMKNEHRSISADTVLNYVRCCRDAYLFYRVKRENLSGKQILSSGEKYYIADHGIREAVYGGNLRDINLILENIVCLELLRRGYSVTVGRVGEREIDFAASRHGERIYVQVSYLLADGNTVKREFGVYDEVRDNFPKYVVTMDEINMSQNGIKHMNIRDFLLCDEW